MPCTRIPSRLLETRADHGSLRLNILPRRAFTSGAQPLLQWKPNKAEALRRRNALARLDKVIDPHDLSATLEAHRESNRISVVQRVPTKNHQDPEIFRPSFLDSLPQHAFRPHDAVKSSGGQAESHSEATDGVQLNQDIFKNKSQHGVLATQREEHPIDEENARDMEKTRRTFLHNFERPFQGMSSTRSRTSYFETIRRVRAIVSVKQSNLKTRGPLNGVPHRILEYTGQYVPIKPSPFTTPMIEPWSRPPMPHQTTRQRLETELELFAQWMEPLPSELVAREKVYEIVRDIVRHRTPELSTEKFGSQTTGLVMPRSDVDIRLFVRHPNDGGLDEHANPTISTSAFSKLCDALKDHPDFSLVVRHPGKYPLIGATHMATGLVIQLVASNKPSASQPKIRQYLAEWPTLKPLYMVIKTTLEMRGLSDVWTGGFGSYSIFMMVVASLKHNNTPHDNITAQLLDFLDFYASLDTHEHCIAIEPPQKFPKKSHPTKRELEAAKSRPDLLARHRIQFPVFHQRYLLCLQDPADPFNDLGKKGSAIKDVQVTLKHLHDGLKARLAGEGRGLPMEPLIRKLVGRCDQLYDRRRAALELFSDDFLEVKTAELQDGSQMDS